MSSGLYTHTTRATGTILTAAIYNADHQNHITNQNPTATGAYSDNVTQMQINTSPGGVGSESLATNLAGELERLRFQIKAIIGGAQWYSSIPINLTTLSGAGVADNSITNAKLADMVTKTIKARNTAGTGDPEDISIGTLLDFIGTTNGDILYRSGAATWSRLGIGSSNNVLTVSGGLPAWVAPAGSLIAPSAEARTGSATVTIPTNATKCLVILVGGGGGGGGAVHGGCPDSPSTGGGGGGGGALIKYLSGLTPGNNLSLTIGAAGSGGNNTGTNGTAGGNSSLASGTQTITTLTANGGALGTGATAGSIGAGGAGGTATNGDSNHTGQQGGKTTPTGGGPGIGFGQGGAFTGANAAGVAGTGWGAGGEGASSTITGFAGGAGTAGGALFIWFA